ncbi:hypothetical protein ACHAWU_000502 [Discostella pseudostelligera]|uniref:Uncharacterized protein n=1 Tax=Discostella pseudostelligera TaxID=259834 RepID=A0ABD3MC48_9STRA
MHFLQSLSRVCISRTTTTRLPSPLQALIWLSIFSMSNLVVVANAYRHGDAVGILIKTHTPSSGSKTLEAYRHQLPRFGISTVAHFDVMNLLDADEEFIAHSTLVSENDHRRQQQQRQGQQLHQQREHLRFSLSFDGGFHHIPWMDVYNPSNGDGGKALSNLVITIVYSSSDGSIHGVHYREAKYRNVGDSISSSTSDGVGEFGDDSNNDMPKSFNVEYIWVNEADVDVRGGLLVLFGAVFIASLYGMVGAFKSSNLDDDIGGGYSVGKTTKIYKGKVGSLSLLNGAGDVGSPRDVGFEKSL